MALASGTRLGPYEITAQIGAGGMGEVYRATDTKLDRDVAIKVLPESLAGDPERIARFQREAKTLAALNHPHICTIHDVGRQDGIDFLVMEHLEGETLAQRLTKGALPLDQALQVAIQIADALDRAHRKGIVHRDLKPGNIMLTNAGAKLLDFGLAKLRAEVVPFDSAMPTVEVAPAHRTNPGTLLGTVAYMAPEQARGDEVDLRTDLFSFGVALHEMATGVLPFPGSTSAIIFDAILNRPPAALDRMDLNLARIVGKTLEKSPELRYQSAADLRSDLVRLKRDSESGNAGTPRRAVRPTGARKGIDSLAVLPLATAGGDADAEYLSEGIAESLINSLSQLGRLRVVPPQKSFRYSGAGVDLQRAARELNVRAIVTGRVMLRGDTLVVKMNLVDVEKDAHLWGQQFTTKMADIFVLQDDIADQVLQALKVKLTGERKRRARKSQQSTEVYHLYLKGRYYSAKRTPPNTQRALGFYQQALDRDPTYAAAYAGVADCYAYLGLTPYGTMKPSEAFPRAKAAADKALALDDSLGDAYASLGMCGLFYDWDWDASERAFQQCLELTPDSMGVRVWYPILLVAIGRAEEAIREAHRALELDPLSVNAATMLGQVLYYARRFDASETALRRALEIDPNYPTAVVFLGLVHLARQEFAEGVAAVARAASVHPHHLFLGTLGMAYGLAGRHHEAAGILDQLTDLADRSYVSPYSFAWVYEGLGDRERWREMITAAFDERCGILVHLNAPWHDSSRHDPFFAELRRKVGLPKLPTTSH